MLVEATDSALELFRVRPLLIRKIVRHLTHRALRAYLAEPPENPVGAVKRGALVIGALIAVVFGVLAFGLGFGISYVFCA